MVLDVPGSWLTVYLIRKYKPTPLRVNFNSGRTCMQATFWRRIVGVIRAFGHLHTYGSKLRIGNG
jgi:hypothetical protein